MKRMWALIMILLMLGAAGAETTPDGWVYSAFRVTYDEALLADWQTTVYLDAAGFLLSALTAEAEITISVDESGTAQTAAAYLRRHVNNVSRYGRVITYKGPFSWTNNPWEVEGASIHYHYMYLNGKSTDDEYQTAIYVAPFSANYFIIISVNAWGMRATETIRMFETEFLPSVNVGTQAVSAPYMAYLKDVKRGEDGALSAVLDFCTLEFDPTIYTIYVANPDPAEHTCAIRADALLHLPVSGGEAYLTELTAPDEELLRNAIRAGGQAEEKYGIYQILFDENEEIVWMMHYNAF